MGFRVLRVKGYHYVLLKEDGSKSHPGTFGTDGFGHFRL